MYLSTKVIINEWNLQRRNFLTILYLGAFVQLGQVSMILKYLNFKMYYHPKEEDILSMCKENKKE